MSKTKSLKELERQLEASKTDPEHKDLFKIIEAIGKTRDPDAIPILWDTLHHYVYDIPYSGNDYMDSNALEIGYKRLYAACYRAFGEIGDASILPDLLVSLAFERRWRDDIMDKEGCFGFIASLINTQKYRDIEYLPKEGLKQIEKLAGKPFLMVLRDYADHPNKKVGKAVQQLAKEINGYSRIDYMRQKLEENRNNRDTKEDDLS